MLNHVEQDAQLEEVKHFYDRIAPIYDQIHGNPWMHLLRLEELRLITRYACGKILDLGCGTGYHLSRLNSSSSIGLDLSREMLKQVKTKAQLIQGNAEQLPIKSESLDTVLCMYTVLNLCNWIRAIEEIHRVLKPGGHLIASVASIWDGAGRRIKSIRSHGLKLKLRLFGSEFLEELSRVGFQIKEIRGIFKSVRACWGSMRMDPAHAWNLIWEFPLDPLRGGIWLIAAVKS